jgi:hypothetical protein
VGSVSFFHRDNVKRNRQSERYLLVNSPKFLLTVLAIVASNVVSGCSGIGYVIGDAVDNANATYDTLCVGQASELLPGRDVIVTMKDGTVYRGRLRYKGWQGSGDSIKSAATDSVKQYPVATLRPRYLHLVVGTNEAAVLWDSVLCAEHASPDRPSTGRITGVVAGLALDVTAMVIIGNYLSKRHFHWWAVWGLWF